ncbi:MAG TPA: biotin/lipoyl-containing protein [Candidatus Limnocylindrales bacterium]|nr:biotin/lipoyl-containing protein [Candidatus Limnocylindrales bacterium]
MIYEVNIGEKTHRVELQKDAAGWRCKLDGREMPLDVASTQEGVLSILVDGQSYEVKEEVTPDATYVVVGHHRFAAAVRDPRSLRSRRGPEAAAHGPRKITAPMPGKVVRILAPAGTPVEPGQAVVVIEAMKMQNELKSPKKGIVRKLNVSEGAAVEAGQALAEVE